MQLCISQSCKLSSEYSSSVPKPINRKDVEAPDLNKKAAPTFPECRRLCAFFLFHNNLVAARALLPPPQLEPGLVTGTGAGLGVWADGSTSRSHRAEPRCGREGKARLGRAGLGWAGLLSCAATKGPTAGVRRAALLSA